MSALSDFYSDAHLGNRFGVKGPDYGPHGHLGVDFHGMPPGTNIPAWRAGEAVKRGTSPTLGNYLIVETDIGFSGYHHMQSVAFIPVGGRVELGEVIGRLGYTGSLVIPAGPAGTHLHTTLADSSLVGGYDVHDPLPYIRGTISGASSGSRSINDNSGATPVDPYAQAKRFWRNQQMITYALGDSPAVQTLPNGQKVPASSLIFKIDHETGFREYVSKWGEVLAYMGATGLTLEQMRMPQAYLDAIPMKPGSINWDGKTVPKAA